MNLQNDPFDAQNSILLFKFFFFYKFILKRQKYDTINFLVFYYTHEM